VFAITFVAGSLHFRELALLISVNERASMPRRLQAHAVAYANPLKDAGILQHVFTFLPGHWIFLGAVCREWEAVYAGIGDCKVQCINVNGYSFHWQTCSPHTTLYSAAVASPATAELAYDCDLDFYDEDEHLQVMAGLHADVETLAVLRELGMPLTDTVVKAAALSGRLFMLQHLVRELQVPLPHATGHCAARSGSISVLMWLKEEGFEFDYYTCAGAAQGGQLAVLQRLRSEGFEWDVQYIACYAASSGSIETVEWLRQQQGVEINAEVLAWAAGADQIAMCEHLRNTGCDWNDSACDQTGMSGAVDTLRWLREHGCPWVVSDVCMQVACSGHTAIYDYIIEQGEVLDAELLTRALRCAVGNHNLQAAQWLRQHGAQWPAVFRDREQFQWGERMTAWARAEGCTIPDSP
jgi:hypothetical protein